jgi:DNA-binding beta-propeller fold protein YncE
MRLFRELFAVSLLLPAVVLAQDFVTFESTQFRPLASSPGGLNLAAVNTPDNTLEIFSIDGTGLSHVDSVPVGLEPVAVAFRTSTEAWVVNHLSDSVSIVDLSGIIPRVTRTLLVGDEPRDIVFASGRAFISAAHRGQNSPYTDPNNPGELTTPGTGRTDVWVFNAANPGNAMGGSPLTVLSMFGDSAGPLASSADGKEVYVAVFKSGNQTTALSEGLVCNGGAGAGPCQSVNGELQSPGGLPAPNVDSNGVAQRETGLIVGFDGGAWRDELGRDWSDQVRFALPDLDVFTIDADAAVPAEAAAFAHVGTVNYAMAVNPANGKLYVANTDANNRVRFEGERESGDSTTTVRGNIHQARITVIDPGAPSVVPRHLNTHIDYSDHNPGAAIKAKTLSTPMGMTVSADGQTLYVAAMGSGKIGVFDTAELEAGSFVPDAASHISLTGGGPTGVVLDESNGLLYAFTRFDNAVKVISTANNTQIEEHFLNNPEPSAVVEGRRFLFDAHYTSANGEASCGVCHVGADKDELGWDLGDPAGSMLNNPNPISVGPFINPDFHPMKGPMTTQTLRGMANHGPMHWRGDRTAGNDAGGDPLDEETAFKKFNPAFVGLLGRDAQLTASEMQTFADYILQVTPPPNPIRALDDSLTPMQAAGETFYFNQNVDGGTCNGCHTLAPAAGFFGTAGNSTFEGEPQIFKVAMLRNMYEKVGVFGMPGVPFFNQGDNADKGDQVRGFGYTHDGSVDTLERFFNAVVFQFSNGGQGDTQRQNMEQFMFAFDSNLKPVVGQQVTLTDTSGTDADDRVDLLVARSAAGDAELIVQGTVADEMRGWLRQADGSFQSDKAAEPAWSELALLAVADNPGQALTFTAVPAGTGHRIALDRDRDTVLNGDDNCVADPNPNQADADNDGFGNVCDANACHPD